MNKKIATDALTSAAKELSMLLHIMPQERGRVNLLYEESKDTSSKVVQNGLFEVLENGQIFKIKHGKKIECKICFPLNKKAYPIVSAQVNGKQKHFKVHRLMAEAFIPNPDSKPQVNHIDGNKKNFELGNLEWVTSAENVRHAYENGLLELPFNDFKPCIECGGPSLTERGVCTNCTYVKTLADAREATRRQKAELVTHLIDSELTDRQRQAIKLRIDGMKLREIGEIMGITRQGVEILIRTAKKNAAL